MITVIVTWLDGMQETYRVNDIKVKEGVLYLFQRDGDGTIRNRHFPLVNLRTYVTER